MLVMLSLPFSFTSKDVVLPAFLGLFLPSLEQPHAHEFCIIGDVLGVVASKKGPSKQVVPVPKK